MNDCPRGRAPSIDEQLDDMGPEFMIGVGYLIIFYAVGIGLHWLMELTGGPGAKPGDL